MNKQDLLHREQYVKLLESLIDNKVQNQNGFSFAIDGSWGTGKTFVLQMLEGKLKTNGYLIFHYNCCIINNIFINNLIFSMNNN